MRDQPGCDGPRGRPAPAPADPRGVDASLEWFEHIGSYTGQDPEQFAFNIMTRSLVTVVILARSPVGDWKE